MTHILPLPALIQPNTWLAQAWLDAHFHPSQHYIGRFAPSPSGPLHQGSLIAALASYVHAHWYKGQWLVRVEDIDRVRCHDDIAHQQLNTLREYGFCFTEPILWQSTHTLAYRLAFDQLLAQNLVYPCSCTRQNFASQNVHCQNGRCGDLIRSWRFRFADDDFVVHYPPNDWTYQLAVVVDDWTQGITHVVRGADLLEATPRQMALQTALNYPHPVYQHAPLLCNDLGEKLSKSEQAPALSKLDRLTSLMHAWQFLGGHAFFAHDVAHFWQNVLMLGDQE